MTSGNLDAVQRFVPWKPGQLYVKHRRCTYPRRAETPYDQLVWKALPLIAGRHEQAVSKARRKWKALYKMPRGAGIFEVFG